jgi:hypothetical protein
MGRMGRIKCCFKDFLMRKLYVKVYENRGVILPILPQFRIWKLWKTGKIT